MEKYITVTKSASSLRASREQDKKKDKKDRKYSPYASSRDSGSEMPKPMAGMPEEVKNGTSKAQMKWIVNNLKDESNPICHSDILQRSQLYSSFSSGHQVSETRADPKYMKIRRAKQEEQLKEREARPENNLNSNKKDNLNEAKKDKVLKGTRIYIDGYLEGTTDIEMKKLIKSNGGEILYSASTATHILTSMSLAASKIHRILNTKMRTKPHVVRPEWVWDSLDAGKKLDEFMYRAFESASARVLPFQSAKVLPSRSKTGGSGSSTLTKAGSSLAKR